MIEFHKCWQILKIIWNSENSRDHGFFFNFFFFLFVAGLFHILWCWGLRSITSIMAKLSALLFTCLTILFDQVEHTISGNGETFDEMGQRNYEEDEDPDPVSIVRNIETKITQPWSHTNFWKGSLAILSRDITAEESIQELLTSATLNKNKAIPDAQQCFIITCTELISFKPDFWTKGQLNSE